MIRDAFRRARAEASWQQWALLAVGLACAIAVRFSLGPLSTGDYTHFMKGWIEVLREQGFAAFGTSFANYNPPLLYLLYLFGLLPIDGLAVVKVIAALFDFALAAGVAAIAYRLRGSMIVAAFAGVGALFIPEVLINSGMWGQVDATYTAFLVWSVYFVLARRDIPAWVLFALALSFKLQAIFLLPWLAVAFVLQKQRWRAVAIGVAVFLLTYVPALLAGRSPGSLAGIYVEQAQGYKHLTDRAANLYQWIPDSLYKPVAAAGVILAVGIIAMLCALYLHRARGVDRPEVWLVQIAAAFAVLVPFVLPAIHERYFYAGGVLAIVCLLIDRRYLIPAIALQLTAVLSYAPFLFRTTIVPLPYVAVLQLAAVVAVVVLSLSHPRQDAQPLFARRD